MKILKDAIIIVIWVSASLFLTYFIHNAIFSKSKLEPQQFYRITIKDDKGEIIHQRSKVDIYVVTPECIMYMIKTDSGQEVAILEKIELGQRFLVEKFYEVEL